MASIKDVAKRAGVSISTVSNVLNETKFVSEELKKKVQIAVQELNYEVDPIARNMKTKTTKTIGLITADVCGLFYPFLLKGVYEIANKKGYQVVICDSAGQYGQRDAVEREQANFDKMFANRVDGLIFSSVVSPDIYGEYIRAVKKKATQHKNIPLVSVEQDFSEFGIDSVYFDCYSGAMKATNHLIECGCRKIAHVTGPVFSNIAKQRVQGYRDAMIKAGLVIEESMIAYGDYTHQSGYKATKMLMEEVEGLDGIFYANDQMALGALKAFREMSVKVPEDVKIVGYDDAFVTSLVEPPLSTVHVRKKHAGRVAAQLLLERLEDNKSLPGVQRIKLEEWLVVRRSTVLDAVDDWILNDW